MVNRSGAWVVEERTRGVYEHPARALERVGLVTVPTQ